MFFKLMQTKTKVIIALSIIYTILIISLSILVSLKLRLYVFNQIIMPLILIKYMTFFFILIVTIILFFYPFKLWIKVILSFVLLFTGLGLGYRYFYDMIFEPKKHTITVSDDLKIVVLETSITTSSEFRFYSIESGIFIKYLTWDSSRFHFHDEFYDIEWLDDEYFIVSYADSNVEMSYLYFKISDGKIRFVNRELIPITKSE